MTSSTPNRRYGNGLCRLGLDVEAPDIVFGAGALLLLEVRFAQQLLDSWRDGESSLR